MHFRFEFFATFFATVYILGILPVTATAQTYVFDRKMDEVQIDALDFSTALSEVSAAFQVPIGLERGTSDNSARLKLVLRDASLPEVLDQLINQAGVNYKWEIKDDVVNVYPTIDRDLAICEILNVRIANFSVGPRASRAEIKEYILKKKEVKVKMAELHLRPLNLAFFGNETRERKGEAFELADTTLRSALNEIVRSGPNRFWIVNRYGNSKEFLIIDF